MPRVREYRDSEADIYWGPISLEESKRDVLRAVPVKCIKGRNSVSANPSFLMEKKERLEDLQTYESPPSTIDDPSNDSTGDWESSDVNFIEKVAQVLDLTVPTDNDDRSYFTAKDNVLTDNECKESTYYTVQEYHCSSVNTSHEYCPNENVKVSFDRDSLLQEDSIEENKDSLRNLIIDDKEVTCYETDEERDASMSFSDQKCINDVIDISSDRDDLYDSLTGDLETDTEKRHLNNIQNLSKNNDSLLEDSKNDLYDTEAQTKNSPNESSNLDDSVGDDTDFDKELNGINVEVKNNVEEKIQKRPTDYFNLEIIDEVDESNSHLDSYVGNESEVSHNEESVLDNTFDEIERILNQQSESPKCTNAVLDDSNEQHSSEELTNEQYSNEDFTNEQFTSEQFSNEKRVNEQFENKQSTSKEQAHNKQQNNYTRNEVHKETFIKPTLIPMPIVSKPNLNVPSPKQPIFKNPCTANTNILTPKLKNRFKDVQSPVAIYIKNSGRTPLYKKVTPGKANKENAPANLNYSVERPVNTPIEKIDNTCSFPTVCYKPAKKQLLVTEEVKLPDNISKLIPTKGKVAHHASRGGRCVLKGDLINGDLTLMDNNKTGADDVSVIIQKNDFM